MTPILYAPESMPELAGCLGKLTPAGKILAGGTDLVIQLNKGACSPDALLCLRDIERLREVRQTDEGIEIGAMATIAELAGNPLLTGPYTALRHAATGVGSVQVRNTATIGGNIANASPAGDIAPALVLLGAETIIAGPDGLRRVPVEQVTTGSGKTSLAYNEAIVQFVLPGSISAATRTAFVKLGFRSVLSVSRIGLALRLDLDKEGIITAAVVVAGAIAPTPVHVNQAEHFLIGKKPVLETAVEVGRLLSALILEITPELFDRDYKVEAAYGVAEDAFNKIEEGTIL